MQKYRTVYALDFPGFGESDEPREAVGVPEYAAWTAELIRTLHIEAPISFAIPLGGVWPSSLRRSIRSSMGRIVFTDAAGVRPRRGLKYYAKVYSYKFCKRMLKHPAVCRFLRESASMYRRAVKGAGSSDYQQLSGVMRQVFVRVVNQDLTPYLPKIQAPSLLIYGADDQDTPVRYGKIMEKKIPDAGLVVLENAGHFSYLDQFPRYISIVKVFLEVGKA